MALAADGERDDLQHRARALREGCRRFGDQADPPRSRRSWLAQKQRRRVAHGRPSDLLAALLARTAARRKALAAGARSASKSARALARRA